MIVNDDISRRLCRHDHSLLTGDPTRLSAWPSANNLLAEEEISYSGTGTHDLISFELIPYHLGHGKASCQSKLMINLLLMYSATNASLSLGCAPMHGASLH